jgi:hypothetical protein
MKSPKYKTKPGTKARFQEHKQTQYQTKIKATLSQWQKLYESSLLELIKEQLPRLGFVGTEVIIDITAGDSLEPSSPPRHPCLPREEAGGFQVPLKLTEDVLQGSQALAISVGQHSFGRYTGES